MYITDDGIRLNAKLEFPDNHPDKCPLVIVIHGFTGHMEEPHIAGVSRAFKDHTLHKWMSNALTVIDFARKLVFVTDIYLCGHSQGGLLVKLVAAMKQDVIKAIIPISPAWMIPEGGQEMASC